MNNDIFTSELAVINVGVRSFGDALKAQRIPLTQVSWRPPADSEVAELLVKLEQPEIKARIEAADQKAFDLIVNAEIHWIGMKRISEVVPEMKKNYILHSGPPVTWNQMGALHRKGVIGGILHERLADDEATAVALVESGRVELHSAYDFHFIGAGAGIITYSMVTNVCQNMKTGEIGFCVPFEGREGLAVWGVYNEAVEANLQEIETEFAPAVDLVLNQLGSINISNIIAQSLQMNDEIHTRQTAAGLLLVNEIVPKFLKSGLNNATIAKCLGQFTSTERWFHPLGMAGTMAILRSLEQIEYCALVTMNGSNGVENGIKVSGLGRKWFTAPAPHFSGKYFSTKWGPEDASPHAGDSTILEMIGLGAFACAASPNVIRLRGGGYQDAIAQSEEMREICVANNPNLAIPLLGFTGPGTGVDIRKVVDTGITPLCHGGIISKAGGQIGAGVARFPMEAYIKAIKEFCRCYLG